jgi:hypothetical protein
MERETIRQHSNSYARNNRGIVGIGVLCGFAPIVTSLISGGTVGGGVPFWFHAEAISGESKQSVRASVALGPPKPSDKNKA